jgi:O-antigen ligase
LYSAGFLFVTAGLAVNIGRSGQLAFLAGLLLLVTHWARGRSLRAIAGVLAAMIATLALVWSASPSVQTRIEAGHEEMRSTFTEHRYDSSFGGRVAAIKVATEIIRQHPLFGTGVGGNITAFRDLLDSQFLDLKPSIYWYRHFHNQYAQTATELGLVGLLALGWIFWELMRGHQTNREIAATALVLGTVYLLGFIGEPYLRKQVPIVTFALFAGLISSVQFENRRSEIDGGEQFENGEGKE